MCEILIAKGAIVNTKDIIYLNINYYFSVRDFSIKNEN